MAYDHIASHDPVTGLFYPVLQTIQDSRYTSKAALALRSALARDLDTLISGSITRNSNGAATSAGLIWPDGSVGTYTALVLSSTFSGAVDSYSVTYGNPVTNTFTQPTITRDNTGASITIPTIVVS